MKTIDINKLKRHIQYCAYRLNEQIPSCCEPLFEGESTYTIKVIDTHNNERIVRDVRSITPGTAVELAMYFVKKKLPATVVKEAYPI